VGTFVRQRTAAEDQRVRKLRSVTHG